MFLTANITVKDMLLKVAKSYWNMVKSQEE